MKVIKGYDNDESDSDALESNLDRLPEAAGLYYAYLTDAQMDRLDKIRAAWQFLTEKQKLVLELVGYQHKSLEEAAFYMRVSKGTVAGHLNAIRKKIYKTALRNPL